MAAKAMKLGELLIRAKVLDESSLMAALSEQKKWGGRLGEILVRMKFLKEEVLVKALAHQLQLPVSNVDAVTSLSPHVLAKVPGHLARDLCALPLELQDENKTLVVAMAEPQNLNMIDTLRAVSRCRIVPQVAARSSLLRAFMRFYEGGERFEAVPETFKLVDAQGNTQLTAHPAPELMEVPPAAPATGAGAMLRQIEEAQKKEVAAVRALVEVLIDKGVFTRDEYLAKVKR